MSIFSCILSAIPGRSEPAHKSEMVSQLIFGEEFEIIESHEEWVYIKSLRDNYQFWIEDKQCKLSSLNVTSEKNKPPFKVAKNLLSTIEINHQLIKHTTIPMGSILPVNGKINGVSFRFMDEGHDPTPNRNDLITFANQFLYTPYLWGGKTPFGIDCSGFVQICYRMVGVELPRDASLQEGMGFSIGIKESKPGDLAFFENKNKKITHVGIILEDSKIIHASGHVKIETLDNKGIYSPQLQKHTHNLCSIKSLL